MTNVITLNKAPRRMPLRETLPALVPCFANHRRVREDVYWLKENAELLGIMASTGQSVPLDMLGTHQAFYDELEERLTFYPQYYRFLLSIGLDLEDLGLRGRKMERLCARAARDKLADAELSDLQRAEARRLLARRGVRLGSAMTGLDDRLREFISRSSTFALPNKKAAYELTHIVFYLSEYGARDPDLPFAAVLSLEYAGLVAYLEQNIDLLAEICVALRQAGFAPSEIWESAVRDYVSTTQIDASEAASLSDSYHTYLVAAWASLSMGAHESGPAIPPGRCVFHPGVTAAPALRSLSATLPKPTSPI
ncbi:MAG: hypothetical protein AAGL89_18650 [Pseudomonadota bacterium]